MSILNRRKTNFVSFKTLNFALRFIATAIKNRRLYVTVCQPHLESILYELTLPLLLISPIELQTWNENKIEYVRLQVETNCNWSVKRTNEQLIQTICNIR